jgi:hypothetical protein
MTPGDLTGCYMIDPGGNVIELQSWAVTLYRGSSPPAAA